MAKEILLRGGKVALVDDCDYERISRHKWAHSKTGSGTGYARATLHMAREVLSADPGKEVDHINGNTLDNRRSNLRVCESKHNSRNSTVNRKRTFPNYKGVSARGGRFWARIVVDGKLHHLGYFHSAESAAIAYNDAAVTHFGEFARLNSVDDSHREDRRPAEGRSVKPKAGRRFKGVKRRGRRFVAQLTVAGRTKWIGTFDTEEEAARAYDAVARKIFGIHAILNF